MYSSQTSYSSGVLTSTPHTCFMSFNWTLPYQVVILCSRSSLSFSRSATAPCFRGQELWVGLV